MIKITLPCPHCNSTNIKKNGKKYNKKQNYYCHSCKKQFIGDHALAYKAYHSQLESKIKKMLVRGLSIRDIADIEAVSVNKVLSILVSFKSKHQPKQTVYDELEIDEFWSYVGNKKNKVWLIYAYHRETGEIVAWVFGNRDLRTARRLRKKLQDLGVFYKRICMDDWKSFKTAFRFDFQKVGKSFTKGIEGNNTRLRHRIKRAVRKTCAFSKKLFNHIKAFEMAFFYINYGYI